MLYYVWRMPPKVSFVEEVCCCCFFCFVLFCFIFFYLTKERTDPNNSVGSVSVGLAVLRDAASRVRSSSEDILALKAGMVFRFTVLSSRWFHSTAVLMKKEFLCWLVLQGLISRLLLSFLVYLLTTLLVSNELFLNGLIFLPGLLKVKKCSGGIAGTSPSTTLNRKVRRSCWRRTWSGGRSSFRRSFCMEPGVRDLKSPETKRAAFLCTCSSLLMSFCR